MMSEAKKSIEVRVQRTILASPAEAFDAWLDPKVPGNPWSMADRLLLHPHVDGLFYWLVQGTSHYGRFTEVDRPGRLEHTWMSRNTSGEESMVTVTFEQAGANTVMTLVHSGLPDTDGGRGHEKGWSFFLDNFSKSLAAV